MEKREKPSALNQNLRILQLVKLCTYWTFFLVMLYDEAGVNLFFFSLQIFVQIRLNQTTIKLHLPQIKN